MGKNELSAHLEARLLYLHAANGGAIVKTAPTFRPQLVNSKARLERQLACFPRAIPRRGRYGYIVEVGAASIHFLSADDEANVVGATASILLEVDEAQEVSEDKYFRDFRPMGATANATTVLYGTAWTDDTLLARQIAANLQHDPDAHFEFPWTVLADLQPDYRRFVEAEIQRLGPDHPVIRTQYLLQPLTSAGRLFDADQLLLMSGLHPRLRLPPPVDDDADKDPTYVAGLDIAGESEQAPDELVRRTHPRKDSTVLTIARVTRPQPHHGEPLIEVVHHRYWTGRDHSTQFELLKDALTRWRCRSVCVDATGVGAGVASWLHKAIGSQVEQVQFTRPLKSDLGYELLAAANAGRLKVYASDASPESVEFWRQARLCRYASNNAATMNFFVDPRDGHDDFVVSLALCVRAASRLLPEPLSVMIPPRPYDEPWPDPWERRFRYARLV
ncbi:MAG: hypothetical protein JO244_00570 [Solirubrobacterales bacterium]|nr:hypothetical protein [Solirubrobacterales bacterium]